MIKVFTTIVAKDWKEKVISAMVDKQTKEVLEQCDSKTRNEYIIREHNLNLLERKETRRHQSFEVLVDGGYQFEDYAIDIEEKFVEKEEIKALRKAIKKLNIRQQKLVHLIYFKGMTQEEVAKKFSTSKQSISDAMQRIYSILKNEI